MKAMRDLITLCEKLKWDVEVTYNSTTSKKVFLGVFNEDYRLLWTWGDSLRKLAEDLLSDIEKHHVAVCAELKKAKDENIRLYRFPLRSELENEPK